MALYLPASTRRRRLVLVAVAAAVVGLLLGWAVGRLTAPTVGDRVSSVRAEARRLDARLASLPLEYDKALAGGTDLAGAGGPVATLDGIAADTVALARRAEWLGADQRDAVEAAVTAAHDQAASRVPSGQFGAAIAAATSSVDRTFGLTASP